MTITELYLYSCAEILSRYSDYLTSVRVGNKGLSFLYKDAGGKWVVQVWDVPKVTTFLKEMGHV